MTTLFISDLHLTAARPAITELFFEFLEHEARDAEALYILGDFFEYWIGDDAADLPEYRPIIAALKRTVDAGTPIYVMHGNRDFLLGEDFARASGCRVIPDPTCIELYGTRVLLMHGDTLCTGDVQYLAIRARTRTLEWQRELLGKSIAERIALARGYREESRRATAQKPPEIMDVTPQAVAAAMREHGVRHLIHGHTHRPGEHVFDLDGAPARRVVLGDWYEQGSVLRCSADGWTLARLPLAANAARSAG
ncbi:MAG TPA: UDP-2,3-diacylglucosamine diphosphatase [Burkholderiales bacterium]